MAAWFVVTLFTRYMRRFPRQPGTMALIPVTAPIAASISARASGRAGRF
jgi:hypothetical protein